MGRDDKIDAIVALGRRTRTPTPRWLWIVATVVGVICVTCFAVMMMWDPGPSSDPPSHPLDHPAEQRPPGEIAKGAGLGVGLAIGAGAGIVIGFAIGRQRRSHSSRKSP